MSVGGAPIALEGSFVWDVIDAGAGADAKAAFSSMGSRRSFLRSVGERARGSNAWLMLVDWRLAVRASIVGAFFCEAGAVADMLVAFDYETNSSVSSDCGVVADGSATGWRVVASGLSEGGRLEEVRGLR